MKHNLFPYAYWAKVLGLVIILAGCLSFLQQYYRKGFFDFNELGVGASWGLIFIFFSKEKTDDEMIQSLKFKALTRAVVVAFFITHLYNYLFLNWDFTREHDTILSISAYEFLALTLTLATTSFYYMKHRLTLDEDR